MTYSSEVLADSPIIYYNLDEASGAVANAGSLGGTGTVGAGITRGHPGAGTISGSSMYFAPNVATSIISKTTTITVTNFTFETWYKRDTAYGTANPRYLGRIFATATSYSEFYYNASSQYLAVYDNLGINDGITINAATYGNAGDGNWHHFAITKSGTTSASWVFYLDGQQVGTLSGTSPAKTNPTIYVGTSASSGALGAYIDEPALYATALTGTRIAAHYAAGVATATTNINVQAPAQVLNLSAPVPVVTATSANKLIQAPASSISLTAPAPVIHTSKTITVSGAMTLSLASANANVIVTSLLTLLSNKDSLGGGEANGEVQLTYPPLFLLGFSGFSIPTGKQVKSAILHVYATEALASATLRASSQSWSDGANASAVTSYNTPSIDVVLGGGHKYFDVTAHVKQRWTSANGSNAFGFEFIEDTTPTNGGAVAVALRNHFDPEARPSLVIEFEPIPATPVTVIAPVMTMSIPTSNVTVKAQRNMTLPVPAASMTVATVAPARIRVGLRVPIEVTTLTLEFPGGSEMNPSTSTIWPTMTLSLIALAPVVRTKVVGAMTLNLTSYAASINLTTNRLSKTTPMVMTLRKVGIFIKEQDRYYKILPTTLTGDDIWYQLEEANGATRAIDSSTVGPTPGVNGAQNGYIFGNPDFGVEGPQLRKAARFDGVDDYLIVGPYSGDGLDDQNALWDFTGLTVEFSIKTSQLDGVIYAGSGGRKSGASSTNDPFPYDSNSGLSLVNGEINLFGPGGVYKVRQNIADGEWHHVVMSIPGEGDVTGTNRGYASYVAIDGKPVFQRYGGFGGFTNITKTGMIPYSFMADVTPSWTFTNLEGTNDDYQPNGNGVVTKALAGDLRDVVIRTSKYIPLTTTAKLFYEWSNAYIVNPAPITLSLSAVEPFGARGNMKKMLVMYGLPTGRETNSGRPLGNYFSQFAGYYIDGYNGRFGLTDTGYNDWGGTGANPTYDGLTGGTVWSTPRTFRMGDFMCYPVSIVPGPISAPGVLDTEYASYIEDATGLPRFLDVQRDLAGSIHDYDAMTVMNYPWIEQNAVARPVPNSGNIGPVTPYTPDQDPLNVTVALTDEEWTQARDVFRDSILEALYDGVSLWVPEIHAAEHLGFIQGYQAHAQGRFLTTSIGPSWLVGGEPIYAGIEYNDGYNVAGALIDEAHGRTQRNSDYYSYPQVNRYRRIVATEPGLTDIPTYERVEMIHSYNYDAFDLDQGQAWDIVLKPQLVIGDRTEMSMANEYSYSEFGRGWYQRDHIESAVPQGVVGKVIAREMEWFYGPNGSVVNNDYRDNVITIAAERGTVLRGRAIRGRAFLEFMDAHTMKTSHVINDPDFIENGDVEVETTWDFDERRRNVKLDISSIFLTTNAEGELIQQSVESKYAQYGSGSPYAFVPHASMNRRGLTWIAQITEIPQGTSKVYAPALELRLTSAAPVVKKTRNLNIPVIGVMRLDLELRRPRGIAYTDVEEKALPMVLNLELKGAGKTNRVTGTMTLSLAAPDARVVAGGEKIPVYIDGDREITLFLKEDN